MLNLPLLRNPLNWATVLLMVAIGTFAVDAIVRYTAVKSAT